MSKEKQHNGETGSSDAPQSTAPPRLKVVFHNEVSPKAGEQFGRSNVMSRPELEKIVVSVNMGRHLENNKLPAQVKDTVIATLTSITGQKPIVIRAKKSVSNFKVREEAETAAMVTLRRDRMWYFLDRLINLATPRIKDFRGLKTTGFDAAGNYSLGLNEQGVFPEIDMGKVNFTHGMNINLVFSGSNPEISRFVLGELGMPFAKPREAGAA